MFDNSERFKLYKFSLPIEDMLSPYWHLYYKLRKYELLEQIRFEKLEETLGVNHDTLKAGLIKRFQELNTEENNYQIDDIFDDVYNKIIFYIKNKIYNRTNFESIILSKKKFKDKILALFYDDSFLVVTENCSSANLKELLSYYLEHTNPIGLFISIIDPDIDKSELKKLVNKDLYELALSPGINDANLDMRLLLAPIYPYKTLDLDPLKYKRLEVDPNQYIINERLFEYVKSENKDQKGISAISIDEIDSIVNPNVKGYLFGDYFLPLEGIFNIPLKQDINARWIEFKSLVYSVVLKSKGNEDVDVPVVSDNDRFEKVKKKNIKFLTKMKEEKFSNLFSFLEDNIFLDFETFKDYEKEVKEYFEPVVLVSNLKELDNYELFTSPRDPDGIFIGVHKKDKAGSKSQKLLHYLTHGRGNLINTRSIDPGEKLKSKKVYVLKSNFAFYYLERFYEDYFAEALTEIKAKDYRLDFISNIKVQKDGKSNEIDVIVFNGKKIIFIELKTVLSFEYILDYKKKCNNWIACHPEIKDNLSFMIFGAYGKDVLEMCVKNNHTDINYNQKRDGLKGMAYDFDIPLDENKTLRCITESSFEKLKAKLEKELLTD